MGDFYDPEHPTEEEENEAKNEGAKLGFKTTGGFKCISSSRFLPKGTKAKVNLEEQGRQKVSFSFSFTKKTLQTRLLTALAGEKQNDAAQNSALGLPEPIRPRTEGSESTGNAFEISPPKPKVELGKIHFKKHLLSVNSKPPAPPPPAEEPVEVPTSPIAPTQDVPTDDFKLSPTSEASSAAAILDLASPEKAATANPPSLSFTEINKEASTDSVVELLSTQVVAEKTETVPSKDHSHIGKDDKNAVNVESIKSHPSPEKPVVKPKPAHSDSAVVGLESDGDSVQTSSSHRSHEVKKAASKERDSKRSSTRADDGKYYSSSKSKSVKDEKHSSYSRSDRDSKHSSYSRSKSDRDRKRSRTRSRSGSRSRSDRGPRGGSSYSRSERSHYYESDRRYHRSSPYRTRYPRSYADSRMRDSSDSEEDYRRTHSRDPRRPSSSSHSSSSYRDSRTSSHSKYDRDPKLDSSYESDRKGRTSSRTEKDVRPSDRESSKKGSPQKEVDLKGASSHFSSTTSAKSHSSKASDPKAEHGNSGGKTSKWDQDKKPERREVPVRRDHEEPTSKDVVDYRTREVQDSPPHRAKDADRAKNTESGWQSGRESKWRGLPEGSRKSPIVVSDSFSPELTWDFVTLSSTDDVPADDQSYTSPSESSSASLVEAGNTPVAHSEAEQSKVMEAAEETHPMNGLGHHHGGAPAFSDFEDKAVFASRSNSWTLLDHVIKEAMPCCPSDKINVPFEHHEAPKLLNYESVHAEDNQTWRDSQVKQTVTVLDQESLKESQADNGKRISRFGPSVTLNEDSNVCGLPCSPEAPKNVPLVQDETSVTGKVTLESLNQSQVSTSLPVPEKDNADPVCQPVEKEEAAAVLLPEAPTKPIEVVKEIYESEAEEDLNNHKVESVPTSEEEIKMEMAANSSKPTMNFISAVRAYFSDSEESASEESESEDTDSDDSGLPRNRLQSVVIVPKTSTLTMEEEHLSSSSPGHQESVEQSSKTEAELAEGQNLENREHEGFDQIDSDSDMSIEEEQAPEMSSCQVVEASLVPGEGSQPRPAKDPEARTHPVDVAESYLVPIQISEQVPSSVRSLEPTSMPVQAPQVATTHIQVSESGPLQNLEPSYVAALKVEDISVKEPEPVHVSQSDTVSVRTPEAVMVSVISTEKSYSNAEKTFPVASHTSEQAPPMPDQSPQLTPKVAQILKLASFPGPASQQGPVLVEAPQAYTAPPEAPQAYTAPPEAPQPYPAPPGAPQQYTAPPGAPQAYTSPLEAPQPYPAPSEAPQPYTAPQPYPSHVELQQPYPSHVEVPQPYPSYVEVQQPYPGHVEVQQPYPSHVEVQQSYPAHVEVQQPYPAHAEVHQLYPAPVEAPQTFSAHNQKLDGAPQPCPVQGLQLNAFPGQVPQLGAFPFQPPQHGAFPGQVPPSYPIAFQAPQPSGAPMAPSQFSGMAAHGQQADIPCPANDPDVSTSHLAAAEQANNAEMSSKGNETRRSFTSGQSKASTRQPATSGPPSKPGKFDSKPAEKPDSRQQSAYSQGSRVGDFSTADGFQAAEDIADLGWDFSQPEKPSSTYQPPDSSYMYCGYQHGTKAGDNPSYWDPGCQTQGSSYNYNKSGVPVPDSLTHCYYEDDDDEDDDDDWEDHQGHQQSGKAGYDGSKEAGSVQAHEISSNSAKDNQARNEKKEALHRDRADMKERGPPKKRRQELGSDSENDAEALEKRRLRAEAGLVEPAGPKQARAGTICSMEEFRDPQHWKEFSKLGSMPPYFDLIEENLYLTERKKNKSHRDIKRMQCECPVLSREERSQGQVACGEDCLNRLLMIECSSRCPNGDHCSNRCFQRKQQATVEVILTDKKGWGLRAAKDLKPNTFVLEYCGEVLDHKEFKGRVKEYARNKNIHYYFMALKNDEIIDATQKGNCSRFMNHSCDPNCETQKWTVNGQIRVGFFTTRSVPAGAELTFDYQFQRYGREAQKCFCGSANCRGYLGGENRVSVRAAGGKMKKERSRKKDSVDGELEALLENGEGLSDKNQVLSLSRLMVRIETLEQKLTCLKLIKNTQSQSCLKLFLECHGLSLLWIWMAELGDSRGNTSNTIKLQLEIIRTLELLPIPNKNMLEESKILPIIQRWSQTKMAIPQFSEGDGYSSENTSRAHTPLNTPTNTPDPAAKLSIEIEGETPKKLVLRRLKIVSENSMDSAASDPASEVEIKEAPVKQEAPAAATEQKEGEKPKEEIKVEEPPTPSEEQPKTEEEAATDAGKDPSSGTEIPETEAKDASGVKVEEAVETPSQDEEEGISDVESERSQEPPDKMIDMGELASKLLDGWKDLKEVYRIPKKTPAEKEHYDRHRESSGGNYQTPTSKSHTRERDSERQSQRKRKQSPSPPSFYERSAKRGEDRYDTPATSKKKSRQQDRNKLSTEERRKLFEQEVAQREAQKQQMQNIGMTSPIPYESLPYGAPLPPPFITYPQGYPMQTYLDPTNPNMGKVLLPTPPLDSVGSPNSYDPSQGMVNAAMMTPQPVVQHVAAPMDVPSQQYASQPESLVQQDPNVNVMPVAAPNAVPAQTYGAWDPKPPAVAVQQHQPQPPYPPPPAQPTIYYQGQACSAMYGMAAAYAQTTQPMMQSYAQPGLQYMPGQQMYAAHPQGVVMQQPPPVAPIVPPGQPPALQQPEMGLPANNIMDLPPPSPPKPKTIVLPPSWKTARDPEGKIYYYHVITRQTQWDPPSWENAGEEGGSLEHEAEMDLGTPTYDENPMKSSKKAKTAEADTSSELAKKSKEVFRKEMSQFIVQCLNPYRKPDCKIGRINNTEDFKHLARKLTHGVMNKELKYCKNPEDLDCNENVKHKTKEYIKKYMQKFGSVYKPKEDIDME